MNKMPGIHVTANELEHRINLVSKDASPDKVNDILGGRPYKEEDKAGVKRKFWRFYLTDREESVQHYEVFLGEFMDERLVFWTIIPHGTS